jgi:hypothetical protein
MNHNLSCFISIFIGLIECVGAKLVSVLWFISILSTITLSSRDSSPEMRFSPEKKRRKILYELGHRNRYRTKIVRRQGKKEL